MFLNPENFYIWLKMLTAEIHLLFLTELYVSFNPDFFFFFCTSLFNCDLKYSKTSVDSCQTLLVLELKTLTDIKVS